MPQMLYSYGWFLEGKKRSRYAKEFTVALRVPDPDHAPAAANAKGKVVTELAAAETANEVAAAAAGYAGLPPTFRALLSKKVVKANSDTEGWEYLPLDSVVYFELNKVCQ
jgi:hypothetical protein